MKLTRTQIQKDIQGINKTFSTHFKVDEVKGGIINPNGVRIGRDIRIISNTKQSLKDLSERLEYIDTSKIFAVYGSDEYMVRVKYWRL